MTMKDLILLILVLFAVADSLVLTFRSNFTLGLILVYVGTALLICYLLFHRQIDAFCAVGVGRVFKIIFFIGLAFFVFLCAVMAYGSRNTTTGKEKVVIVLGAGLHGDVVSDTLRRRLDAALEYHFEQNPNALIVVSGGQGPQETTTEAKAMAAYLQAHGVPKAQILLEEASTSTQENFRFSLRLLQQLGFTGQEPMVFITNDFHSYRSAAYAKKVGFSAVHCKSTGTSLWVLPGAAMREALAICALWVRGW